MLILSRRKNEDIVIRVAGERIIVRVCELRDGKVRLGFMAPQHVRIDRVEKEREERQCE